MLTTRGGGIFLMHWGNKILFDTFPIKLFIPLPIIYFPQFNPYGGKKTIFKERGIDFFKENIATADNSLEIT